MTTDGIAVMIVCSREQKNMAQQSKQEVQAQLLNERVELLSRQLLADLRRQATIDMPRQRCMTDAAAAARGDRAARTGGADGRSASISCSMRI